MALYPSLEDLKVDGMMRAQMAQYQEPSYGPTAPTYNVPVSSAHSVSGTVYPALGEYMGLELSQAMIAMNMPEYLQTTSSNNSALGVVAPISSQSVSLPKATVTQAIREVVLCKDAKGRCGLRLHAVNNGVFICYVEAGSPAALAGLRFGDQVLEIDHVSMAGLTMEKAHDVIKRAPINGIHIILRDRPFERTITLHKDSLGHVGFQFKDGKIIGIVKDSSAARNGLLTDHQLLEVNTINVVGMKDKDISKIIETGPSIINITIIPHYIYKHMISTMASSFFKDFDRTPAV